MNIEDLIISLSRAVYLFDMIAAKDEQFIDSVSSQLYSNLALTEKQANLAITILKKYKLLLNSMLKTDISPFLENPTYKNSFRKISTLKSVKIVEHLNLRKVIKLESPYEDELVKKLRDGRPKESFSEWDKNSRAWNFGISEPNILFLSNLLKNKNFDIEEEVQDLLNQTEKIIDNIEEHVPLLTLKNGIPTIKNAPAYLPQLRSTHILDAIFEARKFGVLTWDENVESYIKNNVTNIVTAEFLKNPPEKKIHINSLKHDVSCLSDIIKQMTPCMIIIPGGDELDKSILVYNFLKTLGISNEEISVTFRLDNTPYGFKFNSFVKENRLNTPVSKNTKVVFVSGKIKKDTIQAKKRFNSVINLGLGGIHYTLIAYLENRANLIVYSEVTETRTLYNGNL